MAGYPKQSIIILGAGFGGLACAKKLAWFFEHHPQLKVEYDILLIDQNGFHLFTPNLYEAATVAREDVTPLEVRKVVGLDIEEVISGTRIKFIQDTVKAVDLEKRIIQLEEGGQLSFAFAVLALGSVSNFFGIPGAEDYAYPLKTLKDAIRLRAALEQCLKTKGGNIVIVGAGSTGVELAGEFSGFARKIKRLFPKEWKRTNVHLVEAAETILPGFPEKVIRKAEERLRNLGVRLHTAARITKINDHQVFVEQHDQEHIYEYSVIAWAGGIKVNPVMESLIMSKDPKGRCLVDAAMHAGAKPGERTRLFAIGDLTCFVHPKTQKPIPANAYIAIEEGKIAAHNIVAEIMQKPKKNYQPPEYFPFIIPLAGKYALVDLGWISFEGILGWLVRLLVDLRYYMSLLPFSKAIKFWLRTIRLMIKND